MFEPTAPDPPITTITTAERQALREYLGNCVDNELFGDPQPLLFVLMLAGEKPAIAFDPRNEAFPEYPFAARQGVRHLCETFDLALETRLATPFWVVAPVHGRLDLLPTSNRSERSQAWERRLGVVFGYPPKAVESFVARSEDWMAARERVRDGQFSAEEMADVGLLGHRCENTQEGYEMAIQDGRRVRRRLEQLAEKWDFPELQTLLKAHRDYLLDRIKRKNPSRDQPNIWQPAHFVFSFLASFGSNSLPYLEQTTFFPMLQYTLIIFLCKILYIILS